MYISKHVSESKSPYEIKRDRKKQVELGFDYALIILALRFYVKAVRISPKERKKAKRYLKKLKKDRCL